MKLLEENAGGKLLYAGISMRYLDLIPEAQETKAQIDKWEECTQSETLGHTQLSLTGIYQASWGFSAYYHLIFLI